MATRFEFVILTVLVASSVLETASGFTLFTPNTLRHGGKISALSAVRKSTRSGPKTKNKKKKKGSKQPYIGGRIEPQVRPILTDYDMNRNDRVNKARLAESIDCEHFASCPGCVVNEDVSSIDIIHSAKLFFSSTGVRKKRLDVKPEEVVTELSDDGFFDVVVPAALKGWRTQAKLAVATRSSSWAREGCAFGLYERGTHSVLEIPNCEVHHPSINKAADALVRATETINIAAYNEKSGEGGLRYVQFQVERTTGRVCLTLVWNAEGLKNTQPALTRLIKELQRIEPDLWHSIWCHCNDGPGNNIFARSPNRWHRMVGQEFVREPLPVGDKGWLYFSPLAFRQGNMDGFDVLAKDAARSVPGGSRVCELYAGVGLLGLTTLAYHAGRGDPLVWVRCSDENPANPRCFERSVNSMPNSVTGKGDGGRKKKEEELTLGEMAKLMEAGAPDPFGEEKEKTSYMVASARKALFEGQALGADVIIVDPPRKGLEPEVLDELCKPYNQNQDFVEDRDMLRFRDHRVNWTNDVKTLVYVSCGFDALARDCESLLRSNAGWMLESATGYILFPGSDHVETLAVFQRR